MLILLVEYNLLIRECCVYIELPTSVLPHGLANCSPSPVLEINLYWKQPCSLPDILSMPCAMMAELRGSDRDHMVTPLQKEFAQFCSNF